MKTEGFIEQAARRASKGDDNSFVALCETMKLPLYRAAKGILGDEALALDAVSEAVYRAYKGIRRLKRPEYAATWFMRILINAANDIYAKQKHEIATELSDDMPYYDEDGNRAFCDMIGHLPEELRAILSLKYYTGFTLEEISGILDIPSGTVKSRLHRALKLLRTEVEQ